MMAVANSLKHRVPMRDQFEKGNLRRSVDRLTDATSKGDMLVGQILDCRQLLTLTDSPNRKVKHADMCWYLEKAESTVFDFVVELKQFRKHCHDPL